MFERARVEQMLSLVQSQSPTQADRRAFVKLKVQNKLWAEDLANTVGIWDAS
jgi:hypothetical protein